MGENLIISPSKFNKYCTAALLLLCSIFNCHAQDYNDLGSWFAVRVNRNISNQLSASVRLEHRTFDSFQSLNQAYCRASVYWKATSWLRFGQHIDWAYTPSGDRIRIIPGIRLSYKTSGGTSMYLREWYMRTVYPGTEVIADNTLRTKAGFSHRIGDTDLTPHLDYEIFYWDSISQHRFFAGSKFHLSDSTYLDVFYLYQLLPLRSSGTHIVGATLAITLQ